MISVLFLLFFADIGVIRLRSSFGGGSIGVDFFKVVVVVLLVVS